MARNVGEASPLCFFAIRHTRIEQEFNQRMLSDPAVLAIVAKYRQPRSSGYFDLLTFLAKTRDPELDRIMAAGVDEVAGGFKREWNKRGTLLVHHFGDWHSSAAPDFGWVRNARAQQLRPEVAPSSQRERFFRTIVPLTV